MVRTALYNWAYARHTGGKLIFRVEDTDAARDSEESYRQLVDALTWLEIDWDEGVEKGGPHEPYRQSQRREIYAEVLEKLIASGAVYESYSTAEEIDARNEAAGRAKQLGYDNFDRDLTDEQKAAFRAEGREPAWRLRVPDHDLTYVDLIRGEVTFPPDPSPTSSSCAGRPGALHLHEPGRRRAHGHHPRHPRRGPHALDRASARALRRAHRRRRHRLRAALRHMPLVLARPATRSSPSATRRPTCSCTARSGFIHEGLLNYLRCSAGRSPRTATCSPRRARRRVRHRRREPEPGPLRPEEGRVDQRRPHPHARAEDFAARLVPYLAAAGLVENPPTARSRRRWMPRRPSCRSACSCSARRRGSSASCSATRSRTTTMR
jgi:glutamyl-tRNA synthetase